MFGSVLPGVIFLGAMVIKVATHGADALLLAALWNVYVIWFLISVALLILPPLAVFFARREMFKEFLIYEAGGMGLFGPLWLMLATDLAGESFVTLFTEGVVGGLIGFGPGGTIEPIDVGNVFLVPILAFSILFGIYILRPSFILRYGDVNELPELTALKESAASPEDALEAEMPGVAPPEATADTVANLRDILIQINTPEPTINVILSSGIATTPDFVSTSPAQLAAITGMDRKAAEDLLMAVQKKLWFGGIS
jgi:hypothetical protein